MARRPARDAPRTAATSAVRVATFVDRVVGETGLTRLQIRLLRMLADGPAFGAVLARRLAVARPNLSVIVDALVERGYLDRAADADDRRRTHYSLTPAGRTALASAEGRITKRLDTALAQLSQAEAGDARRGLALVARALDLEVARLVAERTAARPDRD